MKLSKDNKENILLVVSIIAVVVAAVFAYITYNNLGLQKQSMFTGWATASDNATVNLTVIQTVVINFTKDNINFGGGRHDVGANNATLTTIPALNNSGGNWTNVTSGFILENIGNVNVSIYLLTWKSAATFLGGTNPQYQYNVTPVSPTTGLPLASPGTSCMNFTTLATWFDVNNTFVSATRGGEGNYICRNFSYIDTTDVLRIDLKLVVPSDSFTGSLGDIMTASAYAAY
jgi:hypothetical protein